MLWILPYNSKFVDRERVRVWEQIYGLNGRLQVELGGDDVTSCCWDWHFIDLVFRAREWWLRRQLARWSVRDTSPGGNIQWRVDEKDVNVIHSRWTCRRSWCIACFSSAGCTDGRPITDQKLSVCMSALYKARPLLLTLEF